MRRIGLCQDRLVDELSEEDFQQLYGRWQPFTPRKVADLLDGAQFPWWIAGGWAAEASGAPARKHEDTDIAVLHDDLPAVRVLAIGVSSLGSARGLVTAASAGRRIAARARGAVGAA